MIKKEKIAHSQGYNYEIFEVLYTDIPVRE